MDGGSSALRKRKRVLPRLCFNGSSLLKDAAVNNDSTLVEEVVSTKDRLGITNTDLNESLMKACRYGSIECVELLLKDGSVQVDYQDQDLWTPLHMATANDHHNIVQALIKAHADPTLLDIDGNVPLDYVNGDQPIIKDLLLQYMAENGVYSADLPSLKSRLSSAMMAAVVNGIKRKKDLNAHNKNGVSPLHTSAANGYVDVVRMLISSKVNLNNRDNQGYTPLAVALKYRQFEVARVLIHSGADTSDIDSKDLALLECNINGHSSHDDDSGQMSPTTHLMRSKLSDISRQDGLHEHQCLLESGYIKDEDGYTQRVEDIRATTSLFSPSTLPEMIYEGVESLRPSPNSTSLVEDEYDTFGNVRKEMESKWGRVHNHGDETYDDTVSLRQSMGLSPAMVSDRVDNEETYDDAITIRQSMGFNGNREETYDDIVSLKQSMDSLKEEERETEPPMQGSEDLYDDAISMQSAIKMLSQQQQQNGGGNMGSNEDDLIYDDIASVLTNGVNDSDIEYNGNGSMGSSPSPSSGNDVVSPAHSSPRPYEEIKHTAANVRVKEVTYSPNSRRRKTTTRRNRLPHSSSDPSSRPKHPLPDRHNKVGVASNVAPRSPERSPESKHKSSRQQATVLSDNVPVAWQYKQNKLKASKSHNAISSSAPVTAPINQPTPPTQTVYQPKHNRNHLQLSAPIFHNTSTTDLPSNSPPSPYLSPTPSPLNEEHEYSTIRPHHQQNFSPLMTPPNSAEARLSRSMSPSRWLPRSPGPPAAGYEPASVMTGLEKGMREKVKLTNRKSEPAVVASSTPPPPPSRKHTKNNGHCTPPQPPPRPMRLSSPFNI